MFMNIKIAWLRNLEMYDCTEKLLNSAQIYYKGDLSVITMPKYTAKIEIGNFVTQLQNKTFTEKQIENLREAFGWEVSNL